MEHGLRHRPAKISGRTTGLCDFSGLFTGGVFGLLLHGVIKAAFVSPKTVAAALIVGGVAILWVENLKISPRINTLNRLGFLDALVIGVAQSLALFPESPVPVRQSSAECCGAGATLRHRVFIFVGITNMFAAVAYDLWQNQAY